VNIGYININSIRNKLEGLNSTIGNRFDVLAIAESKLDSSFPNSQFLIQGYKAPFRIDMSDKSGGLLVYVRIGIVSRYRKQFSLAGDIQCIPIELRLQSHKWLVMVIYRPPSQNLLFFLENISKLLDYYYNIERCLVILTVNLETCFSKISFRKITFIVTLNLTLVLNLLKEVVSISYSQIRSIV